MLLLNAKWKQLLQLINRVSFDECNCCAENTTNKLSSLKRFEIKHELNLIHLQLPVLELLVKHGANIEAKTRNNETPFGKQFSPELHRKDPVDVGLFCLLETSFGSGILHWLPPRLS